MPQFLPEIFIPQIFWVLLLFGLLYFVIARSGISKVERILEEREQKISDDLKAAKRAQRESVETSERYDAEIQKAKAQATKLISEARAQAKTEAEVALKKLDRKITAKVSDAEAEIKSAQAKAIAELDAVAQKSVETILSRFVGLTPDESDIKVATRDAKQKSPPRLQSVSTKRMKR